MDYLFHKTGVLRGKPRGYAFVEYTGEEVSVRCPTFSLLHKIYKTKYSTRVLPARLSAFSGADRAFAAPALFCCSDPSPAAALLRRNVTDCTSESDGSDALVLALCRTRPSR